MKAKLSEAPFHRCALRVAADRLPEQPLYRPPVEADSVFLLSLHYVPVLISVPLHM